MKKYIIIVISTFILLNVLNFHIVNADYICGSLNGTYRADYDGSAVNYGGDYDCVDTDGNGQGYVINRYPWCSNNKYYWICKDKNTQIETQCYQTVSTCNPVACTSCTTWSACSNGTQSCIVKYPSGCTGNIANRSCGTAGVCNNSVVYGCYSGYAINQSQSGNTYYWYCASLNGGLTSSQCSLTVTPPCTSCTTWSACSNGTQSCIVKYPSGCTGNIANQSCGISGVCGSAVRNFTYDATSYSPYSQCTTGTPSSTAFPAQGSSTSWICQGSNGGINSGNCVASRDLAFPASLTCTGSSATSISCSWSSVSGATSYQLERNLSTTVYNGSGTSYANTGLACGTTYIYRVKACNSNGCSSWKAATGTTAACAPAIPASLTCTGSSATSISCSWSSVSGATSYQLERNLSATVYNGSGTSYSNTGLACGTTYIYRVKACNSTGCSGWRTANGSTVACAPAIPVSLTCTGSSATSINCSWSSVSGATSYQLQRSSSTVYNGTATSYSNTGLACGTTYNYQVRACNAGGCSGWRTANGSTVACTPAIPASLTCTGTSDSSISCSWSNVSGATSYQLQRSSSTIYNGSATSYSNTGLACGTTYNYRVRACNAGGCSGWRTATGTTAVCTPAIPASLTCTGTSDSSISCSWSAVSGAINYQLERNLTTTIYSNSGTSYIDTGLACGTAYIYRVRACNAGGCSGWRATIGLTATCSDCGSANNTGFLVKPTTNLCNLGTPSEVILNGNIWTWTCTYEEIVFSCSATRSNPSWHE